ncbi:2-acyl-glycerophospho-ethanolamine acyltransferase [Roseivivax sp. THAF40]|uniref:lysophospholipid acyltransferase family protein n=1 Tax=unclassified Roseivivax TaxID=2639302 RepID=UPI0012689A09|nr:MULTISPECIES: lysophospholipid acyltransferase family protein [unclassified Roseivivax]QFS82466.1 2-acyl-glycerophospho-ethanolamine acyltransferase [Roseivivax sp. THAF197b]QFT46235.1 2-acyl-glycerophospho-ethanolamine acyltransferase [Roseivivax sp. THAF40]
MTTWEGPEEPAPPRLGATDWLRVAWRGVPLGIVVFGGLALLLLTRLIERPLCGMRRPVTPYITQGVCRAAFTILRLPIRHSGAPLREHGALVANHTSWLDIFALNSRMNLYFVSKAEVAKWPGIGWLARATGTVFIERDRRRASEQTRMFEWRLHHGHKLVFFPEGTSTDGLRVLPFKTTLFEAFLNPRIRHEMRLQAVTLRYHPPEGAPGHFYGWWGGMDFGSHLLKTLAAPRQGAVELIYHPPVRVDDFPNRKTLARHLEDQVRSGHASAR